MAYPTAGALSPACLPRRCDQRLRLRLFLGQRRGCRALWVLWCAPWREHPAQQGPGLRYQEAMGGLDSMVPSGQVVEKPVALEAGPGRELKSQWFLASFLCFYGFVTQMRPGESFITPYLLSPDKNFTQKQITNEITPVLSYSYMAVLVPIFLLTDYLRYKPVLVLQGLSYVSVWLLLLLGTTVLHMQFLEFFYSITMAARIAYAPYIFSLVQPVHYQRMAGYSRASVLLGVFSSSVLGQLLVTVGGVDFTNLNYISLGFLVFSLLLALFLKRPKRSLFFNRSEPVRGAAWPSEVDHMHPGPGPPSRRKLGPLRAAWRDCVLVRMLRELGTSLQVPQLRLWSLWCPHLLCRRLCGDPLGPVGEAGHRGRDGGAGRAGLPLVQHEQHLAVLCGHRALPWLLPVPRAHRHFSDRVFSLQRALCPGLWNQHVACHHPEYHHHPHRLRQAGPGPLSPLTVPCLLRVLPGAVCCLLGGCAQEPVALPAGPPPVLARVPGAGEPLGEEGYPGAEHTGRGPPQFATRSPATDPQGQDAALRTSLQGAEPAA
ncbi:reduced folate transporter isoform X2 [Rhinolophus sinicus]|uniref:reduced folate transporter isoform X2 n=2 Tax=Rhinolophus sinicus TaxID=89399 RepID=UPI003D7A7E34